MPFSEVPRIELSQDGTVTFYVNVGGFRVGTPVEMSGYATQDNGAIATFQDVQLMPVGDPKEGADPGSERRASNRADIHGR